VCEEDACHTNITHAHGHFLSYEQACVSQKHSANEARTARAKLAVS
jgi:hypothetical protein